MPPSSYRVINTDTEAVLFFCGPEKANHDGWVVRFSTFGECFSIQSRNANKGQPESPLSPLRVEEKEIEQHTKRLTISWSRG